MNELYTSAFEAGLMQLGYRQSWMRRRAQYLVYFNRVRDRYSYKVFKIVDLDSVLPVGVGRLPVSTQRADIVLIG